MAWGNWSIKGGRFWTPIGYEVVPATGNFFYSHSYTCFYGEPFTHTGFQVTRKINDCWSAGGRMEWFRDDDGVRVVAGNAGNYYEATLGVNYKPHSNFLIRPEIRWDWYDGVIAGGNHPFNNGQSDSQFSGGFDMIVTF